MDCVFCKIARKEIPAEILYEDENFVAFLDVNPRSTGMTLIIPKNHVKNLNEDEELSKNLFQLAIKLNDAIKNALMPLATCIAYLPSQIEHLHLRIYPYFENEIPLIENKPKEVKGDELKRIGDVIRKNISWGKKIEEKIEEEKREEVKKNEEKKEEEGSKEMSRRKRDWLIA